MTEENKTTAKAPRYKRQADENRSPTPPQRVLDLMPGFEDVGASAKELTFACEYIASGFSAPKAYKKIYPQWAGAKNPSAAVPTWFLRRPRVQELVALYMTTWLREKGNELQHRVVDTLFTQAFYDPSVFMDVDGSPRFKSWDEIPENLRCCVVKIDTKFYGKDARPQSTITLIDRNQALMALAKYVSITQAGPGVGTRSNSVTPETELLLSSVLSAGRKDPFSSIQRDNARGISSSARLTAQRSQASESTEQPQEPTILGITGLG